MLRRRFLLIFRVRECRGKCRAIVVLYYDIHVRIINFASEYRVSATRRKRSERPGRHRVLAEKLQGE